MIKIPLSQIIEKIKEKSNLSEEDINSRIQQKMEQLSGLISREGAAHIIANELGIKLFESVSGKLQIKNILAGMRDVEIVGKVQQIFPVNEFQRQDGSSGKVASLITADETGSIRIVLWGAQTDILKGMKENDTIRVISGYTKENNNRLEVHINEKSKIEVNPKGEVIGEVKRYTSKRKSISELKENDNDIELLGTIVQAFEPRFFEVCPQCNKRVRQRDEGFFCEEHKTVAPDYSYVLNLILDDGTETVRTVFFRKQAENLLEMEKQKILEYKDYPEKFEEIKNNLMGNIIKVIGRTNKNELFDRLEFITRMVFPKPDPKEEIERLKQEAETENKAGEEAGTAKEPEQKKETVKGKASESKDFEEKTETIETIGKEPSEELPSFEEI